MFITIGVAIGNIQIKERNIPELPKFKVDLAQQREAGKVANY